MRSSKKYASKDYENLRAGGRIMRVVFSELEKHVCPGISTLEIDALAESLIRKSGAEPAFKGYQGYKHTICASVNEESIHGIPSKKKILKNGDIISVDVGIRYMGMCTDACRTFAVGEISTEARALVDATRECFNVAVKGLRAGLPIKTIGQKIEKFVAGRYGIIETFFGHGIGASVHEGPIIPNFDVSRADVSPRLVEVADIVLQDGDIICIEPMLNAGTKDIITARDGWTILTADGGLAAHYENTIIITKNGVEIVT